MTLTEQVKILDDKIKPNKAQYDLDRQAAKISALSSGELEKYGYLTGEDLGYKPDVVQKVKFQYSPLGEAFHKAFKKDDKNKKVIKYNNDLIYSSVHDFNKHSFPNFNEISSIDSKFDTINKFYKDLVKLNNVKSRDDKKQKKQMCQKMEHSFTISGLICITKNMSKFFKLKMKVGRKKHDYKRLKDFTYQADEVNKAM